MQKNKLPYKKNRKETMKEIYRVYDRWTSINLYFGNEVLANEWIKAAENMLHPEDEGIRYHIYDENLIETLKEVNEESWI